MYAAGQVPPPTGGAAPTVTSGPPQPTIYQPPSTNTPFPMTALGTPSITLKGDTDPKTMQKMLEGQSKMMGWAMIGNGAATLMNGLTGIYGMALQGEVIGKYYGYMNKVADNALTIGLKQADVQMGLAQLSLVSQKSGQDFQYKIAQLNANLQKSLVRITEENKNIRADKYIANNQFLAKQYFTPQPYTYGQPVSYSRT